MSKQKLWKTEKTGIENGVQLFSAYKSDQSELESSESSIDEKRVFKQQHVRSALDANIPLSERKAKKLAIE